MGAKRRKARKRIGLFNKEKGNYESDIGDEIDPNQFNNTYLLQMLEAIARKLQTTKVVCSFIYISSIHKTI